MRSREKPPAQVGGCLCGPPSCGGLILRLDRRSQTAPAVLQKGDHRLETVVDGELLSLRPRTRDVADRHLIDTMAMPQQLGRHLRLEVEAARGEVERQGDLPGHELVA